MRQGDGAVRQAKRTPRSPDFTIEFDRRKKSIGSFNGTYSFSMIICGQTVPHADRGLGRDCWGTPSQPQGFRWRRCSK